MDWTQMKDLDEKETRRAGVDSQAGSIVIIARNGDRNAFNKLVDLFWGDIFRMVYYRLFSRTDAEDLTQEIFMRAFSKLPKLQETEKFKPWLYSIAVNRVRDFLRKSCPTGREYMHRRCRRPESSGAPRPASARACNA